MAHQVVRGLLAAALIALAGCDKLPGFSQDAPKQDAASATPTASAPSAAVTPERPAVAPDEVLASVNGVPISKADLIFRIEELKVLVKNIGQAWKPLTTEQLDGLLKELVNAELMSQDAAARGLARSTEAQQRWEMIRRGFFAQQWLEWHRTKLEVGSDDVERYYEQNKLGFREPERRRLRQLTVESESQAKQALARLLGESMDFAALVQQISVSANASNGGMIAEWVMRANEKAFMYGTDADAKTAGVISLDPALEAAVFAIDQVNGFSNYVKGSDNRYHIFQLVERKEARQRPSSEVWDGIKNFLLMQKLQEAMNELKGKAKIEEFPERLTGVDQ